jgi:ankyrin repeat protein
MPQQKVPADFPAKAAETGDVEAVLQYLMKGGGVDLRGKRQRTLLHMAARHDRANVAEVLLDHGANIEVHEHHEREYVYSILDAFTQP